MTSILLWKWHIQINATAFNFSLFLFALLFFFTLRLFSLHWSPPVHPRDGCTMGTLKLCNVYIIHITPQKVLIKLYTANGVGSHRLKVLPISQMSRRIDGERRESVAGVWFEDGFDLTPGLFAFAFIHPPFMFGLPALPGFYKYLEINLDFMSTNATFTEILSINVCFATHAEQ